MLKKIGISVLVLLVVTVVGGSLLTFRPDLSREQLSQYINDESEFIDLPMGANAHFRDQGNVDGPVIVLLHGGYGSLQNWEYWVPALREDYRIITMDLPAHGLTGRVDDDIYTRDNMVRLVAELLNELEIESFTLGGHSMGGGVALAYALEYPEKVNSLVLVGTEGIPPEGGYDFEGVFFESQIDLEGVLNDKSLSLSEQLLGKIGGDSVVELALKSIYADPALVTDQTIREFGDILRHDGNRYAVTLMFRQSIATMDIVNDLVPRVHEIDQPVLLLCGAEDILVPPAVCRRADSLFSNSEMKMYEGVGHMIQMEATEKTAQDVLAFLNSNNLGV